MEFKIGDKVKILKEYDHNTMCICKIGIVDDTEVGGHLGIKFTDSDLTIRDYAFWYYPIEGGYLELANEKLVELI